jgi:putative transposase
MPAKNVLKIYVENSYYHIYNRGVEKRTIFTDDQDYGVFLGYLKEYLSPPRDPGQFRKEFTFKGESFKGIPRQPNNYSKEINLLAYCLMPNHFHLLIKQNSSRSIENFMRSLLTRYSGYFNKRNKRVGSLFQGPYKAILINNDDYLLHLSRYIHLNPQEFTDDLLGAHSSYPEYLGKRESVWVKPGLVLSFFDQATNIFLKGHNTYKNFVEDGKLDSTTILGNLIIENL